MASRKRGRGEMESSEPPEQMSVLDRIRNTWEFAALMQYIFIFGKAVKIDEDFDIEDLETECLKPGSSDKLEDMGLTLLKWISSHRGLTLENWDEYTRRQYLSKAPHLNPYGDKEQPKEFRDFDIFQKIQVLHHLTVWTFWNPDRMREKMPEEREVDQTEWRIEELGYDKHERLYYVLDDNRLYRRTDPPIAPARRPKPKANTLKAQATRRRTSKRRRVQESETTDADHDDEGILETETSDPAIRDQVTHTLDGFNWECIAITLAQYQEFCDSFKNSKHPDEKLLHERLLDHVLPAIEKAEESQRRKVERKERELQNHQKLASAKRSSRLADKHDRERQERLAEEAIRKHATDLAAAHREQERQVKMEQDRRSRMMTREQRIKEREYKRLLHEEELARMEEEAKKVEAGQARGSERNLKAQMEKKKKDLEDLSEEGDWLFDCSGCALHGPNLDDGTHIVACEKCNVWQHSKCLGISKAEAEKDDFHFLCADCKQRFEDAKKPKISLKFRAGLSSSTSPPQVMNKQEVQHLSAGPPLNQPFTGLDIQVKKRGPGRPRKERQASNIHSPPRHQTPSRKSSFPYIQQPSVSGQNGFSKYHGGRGSLSQSARSPNQINGYHPIPTAHGTVPQVSQQNPTPSQNGYVQRPSSYQSQVLVQQLPTPQRPAATPTTPFSRPSSSHGQQQPAYCQRDFADHYAANPPPLQPVSLHKSSINGALAGATPAARLPSPILNRPSLSPTQGYHNVAASSGVPQKSSSGYSPSSLDSTNQRTTGHSPTKHLPSLGTQQAHLHHSRIPSLSPRAPSANADTISVVSPSGTPILPPAETLAPSPTQLRKSPVPTPSKQARPGRVGEEEMKRVNDEAVARFQNVNRGVSSAGEDWAGRD